MDEPFFVWRAKLVKPKVRGAYPESRRVTVVARTLDNALQLVQEATTEDIIEITKEEIVEYMEPQ